MMSLFGSLNEPLGRTTFSSWGLGEILIAVIIIAAVLTVAWVVIKNMGVEIPQWVMHIAWIVALAFVGILAIRLLLSM